MNRGEKEALSGGRSVYGAGGCVQLQGADHPFHLAPAAEVDDVAEIAAFPRPAPCFRHGMIPEMRNQIGRLGKRAAAGSVNVVTQNTPRFFLFTLSSRNLFQNCCAAMVKKK